MVLNISQTGEEITDITKITVPINDKTIIAYDLIAERWKK